MSVPTRVTCASGSALARPSAKRVAVASSVGVGGVVELRQDGETGGGRERVPAQRAGLVDGAERRELVHDVGAAAERGERQAAADHLAEHGEVGRDAVATLGAARVRAGTR